MSTCITAAALYVVYLLTFQLMSNAPSNVYKLSAVISLAAAYYLTKEASKPDEDGKVVRYGIISRVVIYLILFVITSWLGALAADFFSGWGSSCYGELCEDVQDSWIP